jgi:hypothetical protein
VSVDDDRTMTADEAAMTVDDRAVRIPVTDQHPDGSQERPSTDLATDDGEWARLSGVFVDEPDRAVKDARASVERSVATLLADAASRCDPDGSRSTEDLRMAFRRYREIHQTLAGL